ncbi:DUF4132 domain-containing protein [Actinoplanes sp. NPDC049802]|uniref:WGR and DUF4132 domain-containing protein n=1 Tax=Actinoplanes sp. NPDC049802 TaxID=3154742 RepID=UPI0033ECD695
MRSFEFVAGTSAKFWEIERDGCDVTVRFGRVGARGQTSVKTLADEQAAAAHETKLISEKLRKGYAETIARTPGAATDQASVEGQILIEAAISAGTAGDTAGPGDAAGVGEIGGVTELGGVGEISGVGEAAEAGDSAVADEDTFVFPQAWGRYRAARRGSAGVSRFTPAARARATVKTDIARDLGLVERILNAPTTAETTRLAAREWMDGSADARPLGAAAVAAIAKSGWWDAGDSAAPWADAWLAGHGPRFAAEAAVTLMALTVTEDDAPAYQTVTDMRRGVRHRRPDETKPAWMVDRGMQILLRVRHALASVSAEDHAEVVAALRPYREANPYARAATTVLVPERRDWFEEDLRYCTVSCHDGYLAALLTTAANTVEEARALLKAVHTNLLLNSMPLLTTLIDGVGPAVAPVLFDLFDAAGNTEDHRRLLGLLTPLPDDTVTQGLIDRIGSRHVAAALLEHAGRFPARTLRLFAEGADRPVVADLLRAHLLKHPHLAERVAPRLSAEAADRIEQILAERSSIRVAPLSAVPPVLADPPWRHVPEHPEPVIIPGLTCDDPATVSWLPGERERWADTPIHRFDGDDSQWEPQHQRLALLANRLPMRLVGLFFRDQPEEIARTTLAEWVAVEPNGRCLMPMAARFEVAALPSIVRLARRSMEEMAPMLMPFSSPRIAVLMADCLSRLKSLRPEAMEWLLRHPAEASRALIPPALGKIGKARRQSEAALLALAAEGHAETVRKAAEGYGADAVAAIGVLLDTDPAAVEPVPVPDAPAWASPALLDPVLLRDGSGALPDEAVINLVVLLAMSPPGTAYPGWESVREACEPSSLAAFGWSLFEQWRAAGAAYRETWALDALGLLGDDDTVRRLTPLILVWPGESGHNRAVAGLGVLASIGTDVALMHLHSIAQRSKFTGLKNAAGQMIERVAIRLGLSAEQLADRLVPDFGLEADGSLVLDYGPRRFVVGFDELLRPFVADSGGKRLAALPKPGVRDDAVRAAAAYQRFAVLKKDVRTVAADQVRHLEQAMVGNRRWSGAEFRVFLVGHPLLWHIVRRLVWARFDGDTVTAFRVAEDRTASTVDDEETALPDDAVVGLAHPVHLGDQVAAWAEVFADYEILQPFPQLGRPVFTLAEHERAVSVLSRFEGVMVPTTRLLSLERRGWRRETPRDAGVQGRMEFRLEPGREIAVEIEPGIAIGYPDLDSEQKLTSVFLHDGRGHGRRPDGRVPLGALDPVAASEILRDLEELTRP